MNSRPGFTENVAQNLPSGGVSDDTHPAYSSISSQSEIACKILLHILSQRLQFI